MNKEIRAFYTEDTVRVYQAYNKIIADEAVKNGTFGSSFKLDRMTWIKPSFLWMMYRCGWGTKENQEHIHLRSDVNGILKGICLEILWKKRCCISIDTSGAATENIMDA